jgi:dihydroneopterin aldolase
MTTSDKLILSRFVVQCHLGMSRAERSHTQGVSIELSMFFDIRAAAETGRLQSSVDYVRSLGELRFLLENGQFILIETAAEALARYLLRTPGPDAPRAAISAVQLKLSKPEALPDVLPALEIYRTVEDHKRAVTQTAFGSIEKIIQVPDCAVHVVTLRPNHQLMVRGTSEHTENELVLGSDLKIQNRLASTGSGYSWTDDGVRVYENRSAISQSLIHISHPALTPWENVSDFTEKLLAREASREYYPCVMADYL